MNRLDGICSACTITKVFNQSMLQKAVTRIRHLDPEHYFQNVLSNILLKSLAPTHITAGSFGTQSKPKR